MIKVVLESNSAQVNNMNVLQPFVEMKMSEKCSEWLKQAHSF